MLDIMDTWSEVFSTDMFYKEFRKDPMNKKEGRRYKKTVLEARILIEGSRILRHSWRNWALLHRCALSITKWKLNNQELTTGVPIVHV